MLKLRGHIRIALAYFFVVSLLGLLLRLFQVLPIKLNYKYILHAHSHTALLGWIYIGIITLIYKVFISKENTAKHYKSIFLFTNICVLGMLFIFPFQGYALFSIIFSTLFLFASYWFAWFAMKHVKPKLKNRFSWKLIKSAIWYLVISSIGPWAVGGVMATLGTTSIWYKLSIYFYLHFQYNAWFIFALLGLLFFIFEKKDYVFDPAKLKIFYRLLHLSAILSFFLSILWANPPEIYFYIGGVGAVLQILAFGLLYFLIRNNFIAIEARIRKGVFLLIKVSVLLMGVKLLLQLASAFPYFARLAYVFNDFVIGYLHLTLLGVVVTALIALLKYFELIRVSKVFVFLFLLAFFSTEILIFYKAIAFWLSLPFFSSYFLILAILSSLFPVSIGVLLFQNLKGFSLIHELRGATTKFISFYRP